MAAYFNPRAAAFDPYRDETEAIRRMIAHTLRHGSGFDRVRHSPTLERGIARLEKQSADDLSRDGSAFTPGAVRAVKP